MLFFYYVMVGLILGMVSLRWGSCILDHKEAFDHMVEWAMCWPFFTSAWVAKSLYMKLRRLF